MLPQRYQLIETNIARVARLRERPVRKIAQAAGLATATVVVYRRVLAARESADGLRRLQAGRGTWWRRARSLYATLARFTPAHRRQAAEAQEWDEW